MKFIPILFSTPMVEAILSGRKTMTRRTNGLEFLNKRPDDFTIHGKVEKGYTFHDCTSTHTNNPIFQKITCPYGQVGDVLWVREKFCYMDASPNNYAYAADYGTEPVNWNWKPSIHMPKKACRIWLEITNIKVERLQDITQKDAIAEGVEMGKTYKTIVGDIKTYKNYITGNFMWYSPSLSFQTLWQSINGEHSWKENPFVWVISFKRISKPIDFLK